MTKPWDQAPIDVTYGTWTQLLDVDLQPTENIVAMVVHKGSLVVATNKRIMVLREPK